MHAGDAGRGPPSSYSTGLKHGSSQSVYRWVDGLASMHFPRFHNWNSPALEPPAQTAGRGVESSSVWWAVTRVRSTVD